MKFISVGVTRFIRLKIDDRMKRSYIFFMGLLVLMASCDQKREKKNWDGGKIELPGSYHYDLKNLTLNISLEDNLVRYNLIDSLGNKLLETKDDINSYQRWALFLDENESLWVLSSDIGNAYWKKDTATQTYIYTRIDHLFDQSIVPKKVYSETKDFFR